MRKATKKIQGLCLLLVMILILGIMGVHSYANEKRTVKVGVFNLGSFQYFDEDGQARGYSIDYLNEICKYTGWNLEYVECSDWLDASNKLAEGEVDLIAPTQKSAYREYELENIYSAFSMGIECGVLYTLEEEHGDIPYGDMEAIAELKIGLFNGTNGKLANFSEEFVEYCENNNIELKGTTVYNTSTEAMEALKSGEVDAILTNLMFMEDDLKMIYRNEIIYPVYYVTHCEEDEDAADVREIINELDMAMTKIFFDNPQFDTELMSSYFPVYNNTQFTYKELKFIEESPTIKLAYITERKPITYKDENGEFAGIIRDIYDRISEITGLEFEYVEIPSGKIDYEEFLQNGVDGIAGYVSNQLIIDDSNLLISNSLYNLEMVFLSNKNIESVIDSSLKIAVPGNSSFLLDVIEKLYSDNEIVICEDTDKCFNAVLLGTADVILESRYVVEPYLNKPAYSNFHILAMQNVSNSFSLAVLPGSSGSDNEILVSIINKANEQISDSEINGIILRNTSNNSYIFSVEDILYEYWASILIVIGILCIVAFLLIHNVKMKKDQNVILSRKNAQLSRAMDKAELASEAKTRFLAQMSHEIRTPMNAIIGLTALSKTTVSSPDKIKEYLCKIEGSSKLLLDIINDILDMSAIEGGKMKIDNAPFDLKNTLTGIITIFYEQSEQKKIDYEVHMSGVTEETVIGDSLRTSQVLMNLLSNAVKFTPEGGSIDFRIIQTSVAFNKVHYRFIVKDTGCGMSEEMLTRLFEPFEQESAATARKYGGSGLGLSIAKSLIDMMGGTINVESEQNKGTVFTVDIPFELSEQRYNYNDAHFSAIRTLIVDDDKDACAYCKEILDRLGVPNDTAMSGDEALEAIGEAEDKDNAFKLCIVDWKMENMDGLEVTRKIREIFGKDIVVMLISGYNIDEVRERGIAAGVDYFINKPLFQSTLFNTLMKMTAVTVDDFDIPEEKYDFRGKRVLIAEDVDINMEVAVNILEITGIEVVPAENGKIAVDIFEKSEAGHFDCILMDVNMPVMDGYEAARKIRAMDREDAKTVPIYAMTANVFASDVSDAMNAGMNGHLAKPIEVDVIYRTLNQAFKK